MLQIKLTQDKVAIVDDKDYELISQHKWFAHRYKNKFYADANFKEGNKYKTIRMHRIITGAGVGEEVDHINGDTLDNRRENLRICTKTQNRQNRHYGYGSSSYKGVYWHKHSKKWCAQIIRSTFIGYFDSEEEAARAYDKAAIDLFGEYARLNFESEGK